MTVRLSQAQQRLLDQVASGQILRRRYDFKTKSFVWTLAKDRFSPRKRHVNARTGEILREHRLVTMVASPDWQMHLTHAACQYLSPGVTVK